MQPAVEPRDAVEAALHDLDRRQRAGRDRAGKLGQGRCGEAIHLPSAGAASAQSVRAISIFMISELPPAMRRTRASVYMREIGISAM